jgi:hypothetical protein
MDAVSTTACRAVALTDAASGGRVFRPGVTPEVPGV